MSPWTRRAPMPFKASPHDGSPKSRGTTPTWLGYPWRWCGRCCKNFRRNNKTKKLLLLRVIAFFHSTLEILDAFAQALADVGQLAWPKDDQRDHQDQQQLHRP